MDLMSHLPLSPGLIEDLEAFMTPGVESYAAADRRPGYEGLPWGHQLPESPPDSGSENPYSPSENVHHAISVPQTVLSSDSYMLVSDHIPTHEILQQNNAYIYEELKTNGIDHEVLRNNLENVVVMPQDPNLMELGAVRHDLGLTDHNIAFNRYHQMRVEMPELDPNLITPPLVALSHETLTPVYSGLQEPSSRKRKHSQDVSQVKCEPAALSPESSHTIVRPAPPSVDGSEAGDDAPMQCIRFSVFQQNTWHTLYDCNFKLIPTTSYLVGADKGFNYSQIDEAFVCQKKNHFQVTCQIQVPGEPHYVKTADGFKKINNFRIHFYGIKAEDPSQEVRIEQSQSDRTKKPFHPVPVEIRREGTKMTVCRLHFAETTNNNMRKKGRPNPDQRHFQLVVSLRAHSQQAEYTIAAQASDRIIVRASNPGQFESDCTENWWQRGVSDNSVHFNGRVGINTDRPDESCVINGNLKLMGHLVQPSDARAKHNIAELDTAQQLRNVQNIRVVKFDYDPSFAEHSGLLGFDPRSSAPQSDTGVIAQEIRQVLPEAVKEAGDVTLPNGDTIQKFLVVNKDRIFMENLGAVKELCKVTGHLESRIDQLEKKYNKKLSNLGIQRRDSARSSISNDSHYSIMSNTSKSFYNECNIDHIRDIARNIRRHECCHKLSHNSPKYIRRQCKNCHGTSKLGKYYNYNKTCARYNKNDKEDSRSYPPFETLSPIQNSENYSSMAKSKDTCIWLREDNLVCGSSRLALCCQRKDRYGEDTELISNKLLQIIITILIFIMAVCLVVMSVLYFREHQELLSMREIKQEKYMNYPYTGKYTAPAYTPPDPNQIQNPKLSLHPNTKKSRDKVPLKTTPEFPTTRTELRHTTTTMNPLKGVGHYNNMDSPPHISQEALEIRNKSVTFDKIIGRCATSLNNDNKLDAECQLSCLDPSQAFENQEPLEKTIDKEDSVPRPMIPAIPERNITESLKNDLKKTIHEDISITANDIDMSKQNNTDNGKLRLKRGVKELKEERETNEALPESKDWSAEDQNIVSDCITTTVGIWSPSIANTTLFSDDVCEAAIHNYTYTVPLSQCLQHRYVHVTIRTTSLSNMLFLCDLQCTPDAKGCEPGREPPARGVPWSTKVNLDCNMDTTLKIRAGAVKDLCDITVDDKIPFMEYNIHLKQSCHN